jgi:glutaredoxin 3
MPKIVMYSKKPCPFCDRARSFFAARELPFEEIDFTDRMDELAKVKEKWGWQTVPIIVINGKLIGGYTDLKELDEKGELEKLW